MVFPSVQSLTSPQQGRQFYGPALPASFYQNYPQMYSASQRPQNPPRSNLIDLLYLGGTIGASGLLYRYLLKTKTGDAFHKVVTTAESFFPANIIRTFSLGEILSATTSTAGKERILSSQSLAKYMSNLKKLKKGRKAAQNAIDDYISYLSRSLKIPRETILQGLRFTSEGRVVSLATDKIVGRAIPFVKETTTQSKFLESTARETGLLEEFREAAKTTAESAKAKSARLASVFAQDIPYEGGLEKTFYFAARSKKELGILAGKSYFGSLVQRLNRLAQTPSDIPIIGDLTKKILPFGFGVKSGTAFSTFTKLTGKLALGGFAAFMGLSETNWLIGQLVGLKPTQLLAGMIAGAHIGLAEITEATGLKDVRDWMEEAAPGITDFSRLLAFPMIGASWGAWYHYGKKVSVQKRILQDMMSEKGLTAEHWAIKSRQLAEEGAYPELADRLKAGEIPPIKGWKVELADKLARDFLNQPSSDRYLEAEMKDLARSEVSKSVPEEIFATFKKHKIPFFSRLITGKESEFKSSMRSYLGIGAALGTLLVLPFLPFSIIPSKSADELRKIYSGEEEVPIRKGRWWELGATPYEGSYVMYHRPHLLYLMMHPELRDAAIWGEGTDVSPFAKFYLENFTYFLERQNYYSRPYLESSVAFENIPIFGSLLSSTIGKFIKPIAKMHREDLPAPMGGDHPQNYYLPRGYGEALITGQEVPGSPVSPHTFTQVLGRQMYQMNELFGLPMWAMGAMKNLATGSSDWFDTMSQMATSGRIASLERNYWDLELGGMLGTSELLRRIIPHRRRQISQILAPVRNTMPGWLDFGGDLGPQLLYGDVMAKIPMGEFRLPSATYVARYPELKNIPYEEWPEIHKLKIMAGIAPYAQKTKSLLRRMRSVRMRGEMTPYEESMFEEILRQQEEKRERSFFYQSPFSQEATAARISRSVMEDQNTKITNQEDLGPKDLSFGQQLLGRYWKGLAETAYTPLEQLTPLAPASKFLNLQTAIEEYERYHVYGTRSKFWEHPWSHFLRPFLYSILHETFGWDGIPSTIEEKRDVNQYFDVLSYLRNKRFENIAENLGDLKAAKQFREQASQTMFGLDPYTQDYTKLYRSLPQEERNFFKEFAGANTPSKRERILEMVPEYMRPIYIARWQTNDVQFLQRSISQDRLMGLQLSKAKEMIHNFYETRKREGFEKTNDLFTRFLKERGRGETYPEWYRRSVELEKVLEKVEIPGPNHVAFNPVADLEDIKMLYVEQKGLDPYDFNLWPDRKKEMMYKPWMQQSEVLDQISELMKPADDDYQIKRAKLVELSRSWGLAPANVEVSVSLGEKKQDTIELQVYEDARHYLDQKLFEQ